MRGVWLPILVCISAVVLSAHGQCPTEDALIDQFTAATKHYKLYTEHGESCAIEHHDDHDDDHDEDHDDDHDDHKKRKRSEDDDDAHSEEGDAHSEEFIANVSCQTLYDVCRTTILNLSLTTEDCLEGHDHGANSTASSVSSAQAYGYGFLMILFVSLCSLGGIFLVPLIISQSKTGKYIYELVYAFMVAVAVSALVTDAVLHLIPHSFGLHEHDDEEDDAHAHEEESIDFIWKGCLVLLGLYAFYILEFFLHSFSHDHYVEENSDATCEREGGAHGHCPTDDVHFTSSIPLSKTSSVDDGGSRRSSSSYGAAPSIDGSHSSDTPIVSNGTNDNTANPDSVSVHSSSNRRSLRSRLCIHPKQIKSVAWLIIIGDAVHNIADGIALGAAISQSLSLGVSTMFALVFHEIPHEFGDFVILVKSGFHWATALSINFLQSLGAILGFFIGVAVSTNSVSASNWILAITAGLFLYIALTDLLPELVHGGGHGKPRNQRDAESVGCNCDWMIRFAFINIGFYVAFAILLAIAIYEEDLNNLIQ